MSLLPAVCTLYSVLSCLRGHYRNDLVFLPWLYHCESEFKLDPDPLSIFNLCSVHRPLLWLHGSHLVDLRPLSFTRVLL